MYTAAELVRRTASGVRQTRHGCGSTPEITPEATPGVIPGGHNTPTSGSRYLHTHTHMYTQTYKT